MSEVIVVTGGGSGMGLSAARFIDSDYKIVITGRTVAKLETAKAELRSLGVDVEALSCDVSDRDSVKSLVKMVKGMGSIKAVIHAAGISPTMGNAETIFAINALGTTYVNEEFGTVLQAGSCIIDVASMAAYLLPVEQLPRQIYALSLTDIDAFKEQFSGILAGLPEGAAAGYAYSVSKDFDIWYARQSALAFGKRGIRVLSVSPGTFSTPMGIAEGEQAADFARQGALGRLGEPDEIGKLLAFFAIGGADYLTAVDILCDGGAVAAMMAAQEIG
jgi:NAD(P)-dependent dehydrogenase (short-subunit alcohol dehydrogenase family)